MRELNTRSHSLVVVICCLFSHWFVAPYTHKLPVLTVLLRHVTWALWFQIHIAKVHISNGLGVYRSFTPLHSSPHFMRIWIAHCQHLYDNRCDTQISNWFVFSFGIAYENHFIWKLVNNGSDYLCDRPFWRRCFFIPFPFHTETDLFLKLDRNPDCTLLIKPLNCALRYVRRNVNAQFYSGIGWKNPPIAELLRINQLREKQKPQKYSRRRRRQ